MPSESPDPESTLNSTTPLFEPEPESLQNGKDSDGAVLDDKQIQRVPQALPRDMETHKNMTVTEEKVIREDVLQCLSRNSKYYRLVLTSSEILLQLQQGAPKQQPCIERYSLEDLFGCHTLRHKQNGPSFVSAYVCFYIYPRRKRVLLSKQKLREKVPLVFEIRKSGHTYEDNLTLAAKWKEDANRLMQMRFPKWQAHRRNSKIEDCEPKTMTIAYPEEDETNARNGSTSGHLAKLSLASSLSYLKRYLVIINPVSGQGKGVVTFNDKVHPILLEAGIKVDLLITDHAGHAKSVVSTNSLTDIDGILTVGGDGLLYEVVNGLRTREDIDKIASIPVGAIASGSGNGLARSIAQYSKEDNDYLKNPILTTTLAAARGKVIPVNLVEIEMDGQKSFSFLSVGWGLMSDIDVESEVLRAIGEPRFTLWAFLRLAKLRSYKAQLSYVPCEKVSPTQQQPTQGENIQNSSGTQHATKRSREPVTMVTDFISVYGTCQSFIGTDMIFAPTAEAGDGLIHLTYLTKDAGRAAATQFLLGIEKGSHLNVNGVTYVTVQEFTIRSPGGFQGTVTIDGECVKAEEVRVKIAPHPLYVFAL